MTTIRKLSKLRLKILETDTPQYIIGSMAGIHHSRMSEYCLLQKPIPPHHLVALCEVLDCEPTDIIGEADNNGIIPISINR